MRPAAALPLVLGLLALTPMLTIHSLGAQTASPLKVGIDLGHGNLHATQGELTNFTSLLTTSSVRILYNFGAFNQTYIRSIDALIISSPQTNFTATEVSYLTDWLNAHGKLWLSNSYENATPTKILNTLIQSLGSQQRFEYGYATDPLYNLNSTASDSDQVILPVINHKMGLPIGLTQGVRILYGFRPVPIIGFNGTEYTKLNSTLNPNPVWVAETSSVARVINSSSTPLLVYKNKPTNPIPVVAEEPRGNGTLVLTGFPIFSEWMQLFSYFQKVPYDNRLFVKNLLAWLVGIKVSTELEASTPNIRGTGQPLVLIYTGSRSQHASNAELQTILSLLADMGFNARTFDSLDINDIRNASVLIVETPHQLITSNETQAINLWLEEGNKLLVLASMADYAIVGSATESLSLNEILSAISSSLRFEQGSVIDPEVNLGGNPYLSLASNINHLSPATANLTRNVRSLYMQFETILTGSNGTTFFPLENQTYLNTLTNVTWIAKTSNQSRVFNLNPGSFRLQAHSQNQQGSYIVAALEKYRPDKYGDTLLLLGGPLFADFTRLLEYPTVYGYPTDNIIFMRNTFGRLLTQTQIRTEISVTATPSQLTEGGNVTLYAHYYALQTSTSNISEIDHIPISPANITLTLTGRSLTIKTLANLTYSATAKPTTTGAVTWSASASAARYLSQSSTGTVQVNPIPTRFTYYVLGIPIVIFIAVTITVVAKKTR